MSEVSIRSGPRPPPRLSIVIDNYRYEQFVARTIESALEQTVAERVEVIVIDDGSPDNSMEVINRYADRVQVIAKPNGGQASAYNLGFQMARGELILFLDADDWLYPDAAAEILAAWVPGVSKLQFPLDLVDVAGDPLYRQVPRTLQDSEEAEQLMRDWGAYGSPPGSGNVYHRDYLRQVLPLDEATWTTAADSVPVLLAPAYGRVVSLRRALGVYRVHRPREDQALVFNNYTSSMRTEFLRIMAGKQAVVRALDQLGLSHSQPLGLAPWEARTVVLCARFGGEEARQAMQPSPAALVRRAMFSILRWPHMTVSRRLATLAWMFGVLVLPRAQAHQLALIHRRSAGVPIPPSAQSAAARLAAVKSWN